MTSEEFLFWGTVLLSGAFVLLLIELFVPSGGILGVVAGVLALGGVVAFWQNSWVWGVTALAGSIVAGAAGFYFAFNVMPHTPFGRDLMLGDDEDELQQKTLLEQRRREEEQALIGAAGRALTDLRPIGQAEIEGARVEVLAVGGTVAAGTPLRVVAVEGNTIKVRPQRAET
ncbi:MAG: hypothetical protein IBJ11_10820 [Phycisphaerales bacterium]|nr:hypothetical protein [Phycisphaerales bacterium]